MKKGQLRKGYSFLGLKIDCLKIYFMSTLSEISKHDSIKMTWQLATKFDDIKSTGARKNKPPFLRTSTSTLEASVHHDPKTNFFS